MQGFWRDIRFAARGLRKSPGFTLVVLLTLALGIGANTAIFSLIDQLLLRSLPVKNPSELILLDGPGPYQGRTFNNQTFSYPMYKDFRDENQVFSGLLARFPTSMTMAWKGQSDRVQGDLVSGNYFEVLGVPRGDRAGVQRLGRQVPGAHPVAVLSYGFWQRRFAGDPSVLNQTITVNGHPMTIVGVSAAGFSGLQVESGADIMVPMMMKAQMTPTWNDLDNRRSRWVTVVGRLKPGMSVEQAAVQMNVIYRRINEQEVEGDQDVVQHLRPAFRGQAARVAARRPRAVRSAAAFLDAAGGADVDGRRGAVDRVRERGQPDAGADCGAAEGDGAAAGARFRARADHPPAVGREPAARGRWRAARGPAGVVDGVVAAGRAAGRSGGPDDVGDAGPASADVHAGAGAPDGARLRTRAGDHAARAPVNATLKEEGGSVMGGGRQARVRRALVVAQVALSMVLLAGAGLFARSLHNLTTLDPGFRVDSILTFSLDPTLSGYTHERATTLFKELQDALGAGARSAGPCRWPRSAMLTGNDWSMTVKVDGYQPKEDENMNPGVDGIGPRVLLDHRRAARLWPRVHRQGRRRRPEGRDPQRDDGEVLLRGRPTRSAAASASAAATPPTSRSSASSVTSGTVSCAMRRCDSSTFPTRRTTR